MHHLILDTSVLRDLVEYEYSLIQKLSQLVEDGEVVVVLPEIIRDEWKVGKSYAAAQIQKEIIDSIRAAKKLIPLFDGVESETLEKVLNKIDPKVFGQTVASERIQAIDCLLESEKTILLPVTDYVRSLVVTHGLNKKKPFGEKNSMADAILFFTVIEWADQTQPEFLFFVTHNTKDFSDVKNGDNDTLFLERLNQDLQPYVQKNGMKYFTIIGKALNEIDKSIATEEEIELGETIVESIRIREDLDTLLGNPLYNMLNDNQKLQEQMSGGALAKVLQEQQKFLEQMSGGALSKTLQEHQKLQEQMSGGALSKTLQEHQKLQEQMSGGALSKTLQEHQKLQEQMSGGALSKTLQEHQKLQEQMSGGALSKTLREHQKLQEQLGVGGLLKGVYDNQKLINKMLGGIMGTTNQNKKPK